MDRLTKLKLNFYIDPVLSQELEKICLYYGVSKGKVVGFAIQKLIDDLKHYKVKPQDVVDYLPENYYPEDVIRRI